MMAARAVHGCSVIRCRTPTCSSFSRSSCCAPVDSVALLRPRFKNSFPFLKKYRNSTCYSRKCLVACQNISKRIETAALNQSFGSLITVVLKEISVRKRRKRIPASAVKATNPSGLLEEKITNQSLKEGMLLEFRKDGERMLLGVARRPDGKKNWMVHDQNGISSSIKSQQITYIVPGVDNFEPSCISDFIQKAQENLDFCLLEFAWTELLESNKSVNPEEFAEMIFGSSEALESYCAHFLLSRDDIYFTVLESKGPRTRYEPRPTAQVEELTRRKLAKQIAEQELFEFVKLLESAKAMPLSAKPPKSSWIDDEKTRSKIQAIEALSIESFESSEEKKTAFAILSALGLTKTPSSALKLLIDIGYFPVHVNLDLLKSSIRTNHSEDTIVAAEELLLQSPDLDEFERTDLSHLKVYVIDVDKADELDDALSAERLPDGRIKVWIHVADPTRYVQPFSKIDKEAMKRGTSVFLPTGTYSMFPENLAMQGMSLKQGKLCNTVSVSAVLHSNGSVAEYRIENSIIRPTYMLTYESATELLYLDLEEEKELRMIWEAACMRLNRRRQEGAIDTWTVEARIKVGNPEDPEPSIALYVENQSNSAMRLVSEMMLLCGEVIAQFGCRNNLPLPYRGQPHCNVDVNDFSHLEEGPVRSASIFKVMRSAAQLDFRKPIRHTLLGLPGYVQFTSPIRRYVDLLAHYQVKAVLRGDMPPFSAGQLEAMAAAAAMQTKLAKKLCNSNLRYWIIEYIRRQPKNTVYRAIILRFIKDRTAAILLPDLGFQTSATVSVGNNIGDQVKLQLQLALPRDDTVSFKEIP